MARNYLGDHSIRLANRKARLRRWVPLLVALIGAFTLGRWAQALEPGWKVHFGEATATPSPAESINRANATLRSGNLKQALQLYESIECSPRLRAALRYNQGVALFRQGKIVDAANAFRESIAFDETGFAAISHYNLGNCLFRQALARYELDTKTSRDQLRRAIKHYRHALRGPTPVEDARVNIELAARLLQQLQPETTA